MTDEQFWRTTPRTLDALGRMHKKFNDPDERPKEGRSSRDGRGTMASGNRKGFIDELF